MKKEQRIVYVMDCYHNSAVFGARLDLQKLLNEGWRVINCTSTKTEHAFVLERESQ